MEKLTEILNTMVQDFGVKIFYNTQRFKSAFSDYSNGAFKGERELISKIIEIGAFNTITNAEEISIAKKVLVKKLHEEYFFEEKTCLNIVDIYTSILRGDNTESNDTNENTSNLFDDNRFNVNETVFFDEQKKSNYKPVYKPTTAIYITVIVILTIAIAGGTIINLTDKKSLEGKIYVKLNNDDDSGNYYMIFEKNNHVEIHERVISSPVNGFAMVASIKAFEATYNYDKKTKSGKFISLPGWGETSINFTISESFLTVEANGDTWMDKMTGTYIESVSDYLRK